MHTRNSASKHRAKIHPIHHYNIFIIVMLVIAMYVVIWWSDWMQFIILSGVLHMDSVLIYDIESEMSSEIGECSEKCQVECRKEEKETQISDVPQSKLIKVRPSPQKKHEQPPHEHENIIFYEDELSKSHNSIQFDETKRGLLNSHHAEEDEEGYDSEEYDEVQELEELVQPYARQQLQGKKKAIVPQQVRLKNQTVVVRANTELFIKQVVPVSYSVTCLITVQRNILGMAAFYRLFLQQPQQFLLSAKKEVFKLYSNFLISRHPKEIHKRSRIYQGRMEGNFIGTQYYLYAVKDQVETLKLVVNYQKNIIGFNGPRRFSAFKVNPQVKATFKNTLEGILQRNQKSKLSELETAKPILKKGKFRIDFGGKVKMASAKNFVLEYLEENGKRKRCLLFGKIASDKYIMQVEYPLTLYEAFGICLTSLDSKLMVN